jgi:hypothetical protein
MVVCLASTMPQIKYSGLDPIPRLYQDILHALVKPLACGLVAAMTFAAKHRQSGAHSRGDRSTDSRPHLGRGMRFLKFGRRRVSRSRQSDHCVVSVADETRHLEDIAVDGVIQALTSPMSLALPFCNSLRTQAPASNAHLVFEQQQYGADYNS